MLRAYSSRLQQSQVVATQIDPRKGRFLAGERLLTSPRPASYHLVETFTGSILVLNSDFFLAVLTYEGQDSVYFRCSVQRRRFLQMDVD